MPALEGARVMCTLTLTRYVAPSAWASYLINGDASGISNDDERAADAWLARLGLPAPCDCSDAGITRWHDARPECPLAADCQEYVFLVAK